MYAANLFNFAAYKNKFSCNMNTYDLPHSTSAVKSFSSDMPQSGIRRSFTASRHQFETPSGTGRHICYGDRILVRLVRAQAGGRTLAEFYLSEVNDMSEIYGELRHYTRGLRGLTRLYIRNMTRGWSMEKPFMLYAEKRHVSPAASVSHPIVQPVASGKRQIPESIRLLFGDH